MNETATDNDEAVVYSALSGSQYVAGVVVVMISCGLSIFGSLSIVWIILAQNQQKLWNELYHRIVMGLSAMDFIMTTAVLSMLFANRSDLGLLFAVGNEQSCSAAGFFFQFWLGSVIYNAILSVYFLWTVQYGLKEHQIAKIMEPYCHILATGIPLTLGILGLATKSINPFPYVGICDLVPYPANCLLEEEIDCERGSAGRIIGFIHMGFMGISVVIGLGATFKVYWVFRRQMIRNQRYSSSFTTSSSSAPGSRSSEGNSGSASLQAQQQQQQLRQFTHVQLKRLRAVRDQCYCYTAAFLGSWVIACFAFIYGPSRSWLVFLVYALFPLQGFWNNVIYTRPKLLRWKASNPEKSWAWAYAQVLTGRPAPRRAAGGRSDDDRRRTLIATATIAAASAPQSSLSSLQQQQPVNGVSKTPPRASLLGPFQSSRPEESSVHSFAVEEEEEEGEGEEYRGVRRCSSFPISEDEKDVPKGAVSVEYSDVVDGASDSKPTITAASTGVQNE